MHAMFALENVEMQNGKLENQAIFQQGNTELQVMLELEITEMQNASHVCNKKIYKCKPNFSQESNYFSIRKYENASHLRVRKY